MSALALPHAGAAASRSTAASFGSPVKVTPDGGHGYEPAVVVDQYDNIFATAHKENWQLVVWPDPNAPLYERSMSWAWVSVDGGRSFTDIPGLTALGIDQHDLGDEGDMALDDTGHLYFIDTKVPDISFTRWVVTGNSLADITEDLHKPFYPSVQPVDDRPWVIAHGDKPVFYFANEGDKSYNGGRYTVYTSYDGGERPQHEPATPVPFDRSWQAVGGAGRHAVPRALRVRLAFGVAEREKAGPGDLRQADRQ